MAKRPLAEQQPMVSARQRKVSGAAYRVVVRSAGLCTRDRHKQIRAVCFIRAQISAAFAGPRYYQSTKKAAGRARPRNISSGVRRVQPCRN